MKTDNELIANFMGLTTQTFEYDLSNPRVFVNVWKKLEYHTSLNYLMHVVEEIEKLGFHTNLNYNPDTGKKSFSIFDNQYRNTAKGIHFYSEEKDCIYKASVACIKYLNSKKV